jgi:hypothetical protein
MPLFNDKERQIFAYKTWEGKPRLADPSTCLRKFKEATNCEYSKRCEELASPDPKVSSAAIETLCNAALFAFGMEAERFDPDTGHGWTEVQLLTLVSNFNEYIEGLKKSINS